MPIFRFGSSPEEDTIGGGAATRYELRYSGSSINSELDWLAATSFAVPFPPGAPGFSEQLTVTGLTPGAFYRFVVRAVDDGRNIGPLSEDPSATAAPN